MNNINRLIIIEESSLKNSPINQQTLNDLFVFNNFVLLGDPGMGKTYSFKEAAQYEDAIYKTVADFRLSKGRGCTNKTLYLDGLDEYRSRDEADDLIYNLIDIINEVKPKGIRISCRSADWLGATDSSRFKAVFNNSFAIATLQPLIREQQISLISVLGIKKYESFFEKAESHSLDNLLGNPQTLTMIVDVVKNDNWPKSKFELFEKFCDKLLQEHDPQRTRKGIGQLQSYELQDTAGALCASLLISNTPSISLLGQPVESTIPSYRSITFCEENKLLSTLNRRLFTTTSVENESLTFVHRTIAEFISAKWIAKLINETGFPVERVKSLIGFNNVPSSELRGLHAWLAILVADERTSLFIDADPFGIVLYSDPSQFNKLNKLYLLHSLKKLSISDPWFRANNWTERNSGAFSSDDLADEFVDILLNPNSTSQLKDLILDVLRYGKPIARISTQLIEFLESDIPSTVQKIDAIHILNTMGEPQREYIALKHYPTILSNTEDYRHLQLSIINLMYPTYIKADEISNLLCRFACAEKNNISGELWGFEEIIQKNDLAMVLDLTIEKLTQNKKEVSDDVKYDFKRLLDGIVYLALQNTEQLSEQQVWKWLSFISNFPYKHYDVLENKKIINWIKQNKGLVDKTFRYSFITSDESLHWPYSFNQTFAFPYSDVDFIDNCFALLNEFKNDSKSLNLYTHISSNIFNTSGVELFEKWYSYADKNKQYIEKRNSLLVCSMDGWEYKNALTRIENVVKKLEQKKQNKKNINLTIDLISSGQHLQNLSFLADEYFRGITNNSKPIDTLIEKFGVELLPDILKGFQAVLSRNDLPSVKTIIDNKKPSYRWWKCILVAINETFEKEESLDAVSMEILRITFVLNKVFSVYIKRKNNYTDCIVFDWVPYFCKNYNVELKNLTVEILDFEIKSKQQYSSYTSLLKCYEYNSAWRAEVAFDLLLKYPNAPSLMLIQLLEIVMETNSYKNDLILLANSAFSKKGLLKGANRATWLTVGFLFAPNEFVVRLSSYSKSRPFVVWEVEKQVSSFLKNTNVTDNKLNLFQLDNLIIICAKHFKNTSHPRSSWSGSQNNWDASDFIKGLINKISLIITPDAEMALKRLSENTLLQSYKDYLLHSLAKQQKLFAEAHYHQPNWLETLNILSNKQPSNIHDLFALMQDHLKTFQQELLSSNTDLYKRFWRHGDRGYLSKPDIEDYCRDRLMEIIAPRLTPVGLNIERELDLANHKRVDISVLNNTLKLPIELKKDDHGEVWMAIENQLIAKYSIDSRSKGYGIYVVFWFGLKNMKNPPKGISKPNTAIEFQYALKETIPTTDKNVIDVFVLDCSKR